MGIATAIQMYIYLNMYALFEIMKDYEGTILLKNQCNPVNDINTLLILLILLFKNKKESPEIIINKTSFK